MKFFFITAEDTHELFQQLPHRHKKLFEPSTASLSIHGPILAIMSTENDLTAFRLRKAIAKIDHSQDKKIVVFAKQLTIDAEDLCHDLEINFFEERNLGSTDQNILER